MKIDIQYWCIDGKYLRGRKQLIQQYFSSWREQVTINKMMSALIIYLHAYFGIFMVLAR
jgi:hypothetical protein